jgi:predicted proteasome-type protease
MDIRINEVQSRVQTTDSQSLLDPRVMHEIVRACVRAVKEEQAKESRMAEERKLSAGLSRDDR